MLKKTTAIILIMILALSISSPAYAALPDESQTTPRSVEEILNDHHTKIFELENQPAASTYSRSSISEESITQDTISELQAAGYEAYNVTASNYDTLEAELKTDFARMGLDPIGSYIVVIGSEDPSSDNNVAPADTTLPPHIGGDEGGDDGSFIYQYNGVAYRMRYVTVTNGSIGNNALYESSRVMLSDIRYFDEISGVITDYAVSYATEAAVKKIFEEAGEEFVEMIPYIGDFCTIVSLLGDAAEVITQGPTQTVDPGTWDLSAGTAWTRKYIEVYDSGTGNWYATQCSSSAALEASMYGDHVYNPETNAPVQLGVYLDAKPFIPLTTIIPTQESFKRLKAIWGTI